MGLKAKFVPTKWDGLIEGVNTGKYDIVLNNVAKNMKDKLNLVFLLHASILTLL